MPCMGAVHGCMAWCLAWAWHDAWHWGACINCFWVPVPVMSLMGGCYIKCGKCVREWIGRVAPKHWLGDCFWPFKTWKTSGNDVNQLLGVTPNHWPRNFFFVFLHASHMSFSCAWWKRYFFNHFTMFFIVFDHANACASIRSLVEIHNSTQPMQTNNSNNPAPSKILVLTFHVFFSLFSSATTSL